MGAFNILVVDDQPEMLRLLDRMLSSEGFNVLLAQDAHSALRLAYKHRPDAILLDVMMPEVDGFELCERLRDVTDVPILFVTAKNATEDLLRGFDAGADDYVMKPFSHSELTCRLRACLRRTGEGAEESFKVLFPMKAVMLDCDHHQLIVRDRTVYLTPKEFEIVRLLARHPGKVLSEDAILYRVWGKGHREGTGLVKQYIHRLRKKIEQDPDSPEYLHTVWGGGYYFDANNAVVN
jgi:DNA-binding response OmpR family regulator